MPAVSVIIPTYKHEAYILEALESVFSQTFGDLEVIVVNDGSPDETEKALAPLIASHRIRYIAQENAGQAAARNRGLAAATGEFVAFLDDDDRWPADKLEWQVALLRETGALLVGGAVGIFRNGEEPTAHVPWPAAAVVGTEELAGGCPFFSPGQTLIRRSALEKLGGFDATIWGVDDFDLYLRLAKLGELRIDPRIALYYRFHDGNASRHRLRMAENTFKVVRRHFPEDRSPISRKVFRWLYAYAGCEWIHETKVALRQRNFRAAINRIAHLLPFTSAAIRDLGLARVIILDLLPGRLAGRLRRA